ncbi:hypothetical protein [Citrobacter sp. R-1.5.2]|uniref:hypothetical protein n=1 Tax=Citrobacter sp. R-1.5.2 TaxID=3046183 RepID=UPI002B242473|nr:hypothetical protein [Citrobacter sp. R-1.5.2]MEB2417717.1 hypothetical protein [Citrobacter sp. R-1.5.2]
MFLIIISYILFALCVFSTLYVLRMYEEPGKLRNWEVMTLILISAFWLPELIILVISFAFLGPILLGIRLLRRQKVCA